MRRRPPGSTRTDTLVPCTTLFRASGLPTVGGADIRLTIAHQMLNVDGRESHAIGINGTIPGPLVRLKEGTQVRIHVTNRLADEDSSIHWHGMILPFNMDGVPGRSEEHTSELQSLLRLSYAVFCLKKKAEGHAHPNTHTHLQHACQTTHPPRNILDTQ